MSLLFILPLLITANKGDNFEIVGYNMLFERTYVPNITCEYNSSCPKKICDALGNISLCVAYVALIPIAPLLTCPTYPLISGATMIFYILPSKPVNINPQYCTEIGSCFSKACHHYKFHQNPSCIVFTGQCSF
jgi:hypothetical protein